MARMRRSHLTEQVLSETEAKMYKNLNSEALNIASTEICKKTVQMVLASRDEIHLADGTVVKPTMMERVAVNSVMDAIQNPSTTKLKDLANINGELKQQVDLNGTLRTGNDLFGDIANDK